MAQEIKDFKAKRMMQKAQELDAFWAYDTSKVPDGKKLVLLDNVQFIYELALAQLELQAFGAKFEVTNGLREFELLKVEDSESLKKRSAYLKAVEGEYTDYFRIIQKNRTRSVNQYLTHWIYPYKGKFHPQMIRALYNIIGLKAGDYALDPFVGSGTAAVEAQLLGIHFMGVDVSPLCVLQSRVKTESVYAYPKMAELKEGISKRLNPSLFNLEEKNIDDAINEITEEKVRNFYKMAKLVAISDQARRGREFTKSLLKNIDLMLSSVEDYCEIVGSLNLELGRVKIETGDARKLPLADNTIDGIVTSPPYSIALDYVENDAHALRELGHDLPELREGFIGVRGRGPIRIQLYNEDIKKSLNEMYRVLKPGKFAAIVIGNATYMGEEVKTVQFTVAGAEKMGFRLIKNVDKIIFGLYNVMQKENILLFRKEKP